MNTRSGGFGIPALNELLPYEELQSNRAHMRNGDIVHGLELTGFHPETMTADALNGAHESLKVFLNILPENGPLCQFYWTRSDRLGRILRDDGREESGISGRLAEARSRMWEEKALSARLFCVSTHLFLIHRFSEKPGQKKWSRSARAMLSPFSIQGEYARQHDAALEAASQAEEEIFQAAEKTGLKPRRLSQREFRRLAWSHLNPDFHRPEPCGLEQMSPRDLPGADLRKEWGYFQLGDSFVRVISLKRLPDETYPGIIQRLTSLPAKICLSVNFRRAPKSSEITRLHIQRNLAEAFRAGRANRVQADVAVDESLGLEKALVIGDESVFLAEWILVLSAGTLRDLERSTVEALMAFHAMNGAEGHCESAANLRLWLSSLPGNGTGEGDYRFHRLITSNLADLLPALTPNRGDEEPVAVFGTTDHTLVRYNPFGRNKTNYNALVFGESGGGKSFFVQYLCLHILGSFPDARILFIDKGGSYRQMVDVFGGLSFTAEDPEKCAINPFEVEPFEEKLAYMSAVVSAMIREEGRPLRNDERIVIERALQWAQSHFGMVSTSWVQQSLAEQDYDLAMHREIGIRLARHLDRWINGPYGRYVNLESSRLSLSGQIMAIDLKGLEPYPDLMRVFLLYITELAWSLCRRDPSTRKLIVFDEVWSLLADETGGRLVSELYRTMRKYGTGVISVSQSIADFESTDFSAGIMANVGTVFVLKQSGTTGGDHVQKTLNLTSREMELVRQLTQTKGEYAEVLMKSGHSCVARVCPTPLEYWIATTDPADRQALSEARNRYGAWEAVQRLAEKWPKGVS